MDFQKDFSLEYAILCFDVKPLHVYIQLPGENFRDLMHYAQVIYPFHVDCCGEKQLLMGIPVCSQDVIAVACLKFVCNGALTFVDGYAVYRSTSLDGNYALAATVPLRYGSYTDRYATSGKTYYYRVRGYKSDGNGGWIYGSYSSPIAVTAQ